MPPANLENYSKTKEINQKTIIHILTNIDINKLKNLNIFYLIIDEIKTSIH